MSIWEEEKHSVLDWNIWAAHSSGERGAQAMPRVSLMTVAEPESHSDELEAGLRDSGDADVVTYG